MNPYKKICLVGPGAIGGTVAVRLAHAGYTVSTIAPPERAKRIAERGITLREADDQTYHANFRSTADPAQLGPQDLVIVAVKHQHLAAIAPSLHHLCGPDTPLVFLMNGVPWWFFRQMQGPHRDASLSSLDPEGILGRSIPIDRVVWGVIEIAARELPDGTVYHYQADRIVLGRPDNAINGLEEISQPFRDAKFSVRCTDHIRDTIWTKLEGNAGLSPVAALSGSGGTRILIEDPLVRDLALAIIDETRAVGDALGLSPDPFLGDTGKRLREMKPPATDFKPSMLQDLERNRPIELNAIVSATVEIADKIGVPMPMLKAVLGLLRSRLLAMGLPIT